MGSTEAICQVVCQLTSRTRCGSERQLGFELCCSDQYCSQLFRNGYSACRLVSCLINIQTARVCFRLRRVVPRVTIGSDAHYACIIRTPNTGTRALQTSWSTCEYSAPGVLASTTDEVVTVTLRPFYLRYKTNGPTGWKSKGTAEPI